MTSWKHDELQADLAAHLRATRDRVVWENMQLGPSGSPRPDIYTIAKSYSKFVPLAYEIKISVADFRRDVTAGKWHSYMKFAAGVIFAVPHGLVTKADIPPGCGLMVRSETGWHTLKGPTPKHLETLPRDVWLKLLFDGIDRLPTGYRERIASSYNLQKAARKRYGDRIAKLLGDLNVAELEIERAITLAEVQAESLRKFAEDAKRSARHERDQVNCAQAMLAEAIGIDPNSSAWQVSIALRSAVKRLDRDEEIRRLRRQLEIIRSAYESGLGQDIAA